MKKLLVITNDFPPGLGGIESFICHMINELIDQKFFSKENLIVFTKVKKDNVNNKNFNNNNLEISIDKERKYKIIRKKTNTLLPSKKTTATIVDIINKEKIDTIWFGSAAPLALMAKTLKKKTGVKTIVATTHGAELWWAKYISFLFKKIVKNCDYLTYISNYIYKELVRPLRKSQLNKFIYLPPAVNLPSFLDLNKIPQKEPSANAPNASNAKILCISRLTPRKGQDMLIKCMPKVWSKFPLVQLQIVGIGSYEKTLKKLAKKTQNTNTNENPITFLGAVTEKEKWELLQNCSLFAMPCRNRKFNLEVEGLGIVFLEGSLAKKPIIVGDSGGAVDSVIDGKTGIVVQGKVNKENIENLAAKIIFILENQDDAQEMGQAGKEFVLSKWLWANRAKTLSSLLYNSLR